MALVAGGAPRDLAAGFFSLDDGRVEPTAVAWRLPPGSTMVFITMATGHRRHIAADATEAQTPTETMDHMVSLAFHR